MSRKILSGVVVNNKNEKTLMVKVSTVKKHSMYKKYLNLHKKYCVHYDSGNFNIGDKVSIVESRPYSKSKSWKVLTDQYAARLSADKAMMGA